MPVVLTNPWSAAVHAKELDFAMVTPGRATTLQAPILDLPVLAYRLALNVSIRSPLVLIWVVGFVLHQTLDVPKA